MKKTFITNLPNRSGAFMRVCRCFSRLGVNIIRVNYNKAIDSHTLFLDAEGEEEALEQARQKLLELGYLQQGKQKKSIVLLESSLKNEAGSVTELLELIDRFGFNITYIDCREDGEAYQVLKMALFVDDEEKLTQFLPQAEQLCPIRVLDYNQTEKSYDNSIFYRSFVDGLSKHVALTQEMKDQILINTNLAMQLLDERGLSPYRTFDSIGRWADLLVSCKGENFNPRITRHPLSDRTELILIEPPCGSNTAILQCGEEVLFIDSGYACYREEMEPIFRSLLPQYDRMRKTILITHADMDHCGLLPWFDQIYASHKSARCLISQYQGHGGYRDRIALHKPYINICQILTAYNPPDPDKITVPWEEPQNQKEPLVQIGFFDFGDLHFEVYEGQGGHLPGEIVLIDYEHHITFTGDIYLNLHGMTPEQAKHNQYAPILMTSVDSDPALCARERQAIMQRLGAGPWQIFGAHGYKKDYCVSTQK